MFQGKNLNFTGLPQTRGQIIPGPTVAANGVEVAGNTDDIAALSLLVSSLQSAVTALQAAVADHETRITALEP